MTTDRPINLDRRRGMAAQKATDIRRLLAEVEANEQALRHRQQMLEDQTNHSPLVTGIGLPAAGQVDYSELISRK